MIAEAIPEVFRIIPPDQHRKPDEQKRLLTTSLLDSIFINTFGSIDNLSHILANELSVRRPNGSQLSKKEVSLFHKDRTLLNSLSDKTIDLVGSRRNWFNYLKTFRDSLAHQIPHYIPPELVEPSSEAEYMALTKELQNPLTSSERISEIEARLEDFIHFKPLLVIPLEKSNPVLFHGQIINDFLTIEELVITAMQEIKSRNR